MAKETEKTLNLHNIPIVHFPDQSARWLFQDTEYVRGLVEIVEGPLADQIDFNQMEQIVGSSVTDDLQGWVPDLVLRAPFQSKSRTGEVRICILIEHQSTVDTHMALRVNNYRSQIWNSQSREWASNNIPATQQLLYPVIPIVFYTGEQRWNAPLTLDAIMDVPEVLARFVPKFDILLLDVKGTASETLTRTGHPLGWLMTVLQKEHADTEELKGALINAISHLNTLGEAQRQQWEMAISYLLLLILHRRPDDQHDELKTVVDDHIPAARRKEIEDMVYSRAHRLIEQGIEQGIERGERRGTIESILTFLASRFHSDAVQTLKPALEAIDDLQRLKELQLAAYNAQSVEAFTKTLYE